MRQYVSRQELHELLNERLAKSADCEEIRFSDHILPYQEPDEDGCNWSPDTILTGQSPQLCLREAAAVVVWARGRYNLLSEWSTVEDLDFEHGGRRFQARVESRGAITSAHGLPLAEAQNAAWWVEVDGASVGRAFEATTDDVDPDVIRREIIEWYAGRSRGGSI